jgi:hypothetical protein
MLQRAMIGRVRYLCRLDERLAAAMMYGSLAQFEGDEFSDIEFILFFYDEVLSDVDQEEWVAQIAPVRMYFVNGFPCSKPLLWWTAPASCRVDWDPSSVRPWIATRQSRSGLYATGSSTGHSSTRDAPRSARPAHCASLWTTGGLIQRQTLPTDESSAL